MGEAWWERQDRSHSSRHCAGQCKLEFVSRSWERSMTQYFFLLSEHFICSRKRGEKGTALGQRGGTMNKALSVILQTLVQKAPPFLQLWMWWALNLTAATTIDPSEAIGCTQRLWFCKEVGHYKMPVQQLTFSVYCSYLDVTWSVWKGTLRQGNAVKTSLNSRGICLCLVRGREETPLGSL